MNSGDKKSLAGNVVHATFSTLYTSYTLFKASYKALTLAEYEEWRFPVAQQNIGKWWLLRDYYRDSVSDMGPI